MATTRQIAKKHYLRVLTEIKSYNGSCHSALRDSATYYGKLAGYGAKRVLKDLLGTGMDELDAKGIVNCYYTGVI